MHHLTEGMDPRIGPAGNGGGNRALGNLAERTLEAFLNARWSILTLPAAEVATPILQAEGPACPRRSLSR
jgi:hypothetical protein